MSLGGSCSQEEQDKQLDDAVAEVARCTLKPCSCLRPCCSDHGELWIVLPKHPWLVALAFRPKGHATNRLSVLKQGNTQTGSYARVLSAGNLAAVLPPPFGVRRACDCTREESDRLSRVGVAKPGNFLFSF